MISLELFFVLLADHLFRRRHFGGRAPFYARGPVDRPPVVRQPDLNGEAPAGIKTTALGLHGSEHQSGVSSSVWNISESKHHLGISVHFRY